MDKSNSISDERLHLHSLYYPSKDLDGLFEAASEYLKELENYKKREEDGLLLKPPCKLGSKFYYVCYDEIIEKEVYDISFTADGDIRISAGDGIYYYLGAYGDKIFFNRKDAKNEIKQIKG